uniref:glycoside hydrolase family 25 protein n=1 Tax=Paenibacillus abyssi TaxID=1340531 RepID=UPI00366A6D1E
MARKGGTRRGGRAGGRRLLWQALGALLLAAMIAGPGLVHLRHWTPERSAYPLQGVEIGADDGEVSWPSLKAIGADFAYIDASASAFARDPRFVANFERRARQACRCARCNRYDPCQPAGSQAANFVTTVPRDAKLLPPAVELDMVADGCPVKVGDARVESELKTFLNQVETHTGKPVILKVTPAFQARYAIAHKLDRNLWLVQNRFEPAMRDGPGRMWTANRPLGERDCARGLRWVVVLPMSEDIVSRRDALMSAARAAADGAYAPYSRFPRRRGAAAGRRQRS